MKQKWKILLKENCNNVEEGNNKDKEQEVVCSIKRRYAIATLCTILILVLGYLALSYFTFAYSETAHINADGLRSLNEIISDVQTTVTSDEQTEVTTEKQKMNSLESASEASPASLSTTKEKTKDCFNVSVPIHVCGLSHRIGYKKDFDADHNWKIVRICRRYRNNRSYPVYLSEITSDKGINRHLVKRFASYFPPRTFDKSKFDSEEDESDEGTPNEATDDNGKRMTTADGSYGRVMTRPSLNSEREDIIENIRVMLSSFNEARFDNITPSELRMLLHQLSMIEKESTEDHTLVKRSLPRGALDKFPESSFEPTNQPERNYGELLRRLKDRYFRNVDNKKKNTLFAPLEEKVGLLNRIRAHAERCYGKVKSIQEITGPQKVGNRKFLLSYMERRRAIEERNKKLRDCLRQLE